VFIGGIDKKQEKGGEKMKKIVNEKEKDEYVNKMEGEECL
jgi:hypothetical protein